MNCLPQSLVEFELGGLECSAYPVNEPDLLYLYNIIINIFYDLSGSFNFIKCSLKF